MFLTDNGKTNNVLIFKNFENLKICNKILKILLNNKNK